MRHPAVETTTSGFTQRAICGMCGCRVTQLADRRQARVCRQRLIRRADPDLPPLPPPGTYAAHQIGALSAEVIICLAAIIIPGQSGTYRHYMICHRLTRGIGSEKYNNNMD
jgi:hypothetical protein